MKIILASKSKNRQQLLDIAGIKYSVQPAHIIEEAIYDPDPKKRIVKIAQAKARVIAAKEKNALIIAADTFGLYRSKVLEKPKFKMDALETLKSLSSKSHNILTGWAITNTKTQKRYQGYSQTKVTFRDITQKELTAFVNNNDVVHWAAGYSPYNSPAISFIEKISGSITGFTHGLPLEQIYPVFIKEGVV